jgi:tetratricopeptide (TPR) repeat protein
MFSWLVGVVKSPVLGVWHFGERIGANLGAKSRLRHRVGEVCFGMVFLGLILLWFDPVCTPGFDAFTFPLLGPARIWPQLFTPLSFALPATILCLAGYLSWRRGWRTAVFWSVFLLWLLGLTFFLKITCWEPSWLKAAINGGTDFQRTYKFEVVETLPDVVAGEPYQGLTGTIDGLGARLAAGHAAISYGWYLFMFSTLLCFVAGFARFNFWPVLRSNFLFVVAVFALVTGLQIWRPVYAEVQIAAGSRAESQGRVAGAIAHFRRAIAVDEWNRLQPSVYVKIGALYEQLRQVNQPEYHIYRAIQFSEVASMQQALFEWDEAMRGANPRLVPLIRRGIVDLTQVYGAQLYALGEIGEARRMLEISVLNEPQQLTGYYLGGMCCFEMGEYYAAADRFKQALSHTAEPSIIADIRCCLGDTYFKIGDIETARRYYLGSVAADNEHNFRGLKSLTEEYFK